MREREEATPVPFPKGLNQSGSYGILMISNPAIIFEKGRTRWFYMIEASVA
jgi:hypothetical protein